MGARNRNRLRTRCGIESPSTVGFSTVADFPTDCGGPAAVDIHDVHLVPVSAVILMLMVSLL
jgi:hypothetical protein